MPLEVLTFTRGVRPMHMINGEDGETVAVIDQVDRLVLICRETLPEAVLVGVTGQRMTDVIDLGALMTHANTRIVSASQDDRGLWITVEDEMAPLPRG